MSKPKILLMLDSDPQPSVFDAVVAVDAGADVLLRHGQITPDQVRDLVYGTIFTRGGDDLRSTAIFIGGSDVASGEALLEAVEKTFFGPRVSVMLDANGANTTAAAAVLSALKHVPAKEMHALVLAGTGPVGQRVARLLAGQGARVRLASRSLERATQAVQRISQSLPEAQLEPVSIDSEPTTAVALADINVVFAAGAAGVQLLSADARNNATALQVAIDLNAVPPLGLEGIKPQDKAEQRGNVIAYGALGVGGLKMKIHKACLKRLFEAPHHTLDAESILKIGREM